MKLPLIGYSLDQEGLNSIPSEGAFPFAPFRLNLIRAVEKYLADELIYHGSMRVGWGASIMEAIRHIRSHAPSFHVPLLIVHGAEDTITPSSGSQSYFAALPAQKQNQFVIYPRLRHELFHEADKEVRRTAIALVLTWK